MTWSARSLLRLPLARVVGFVQHVRAGSAVPLQPWGLHGQLRLAEARGLRLLGAVEGAQTAWNECELLYSRSFFSIFAGDACRRLDDFLNAQGLGRALQEFAALLT